MAWHHARVHVGPRPEESKMEEFSLYVVAVVSSQYLLLVRVVYGHYGEYYRYIAKSLTKRCIYTRISYTCMVDRFITSQNAAAQLENRGAPRRPST